MRERRRQAARGAIDREAEADRRRRPQPVGCERRLQGNRLSRLRRSAGETEDKKRKRYGV